MERRLLFEHIDVPGIATFDTYKSKGGYDTAAKALKTMSPDAVVEEVKKSGLRGRGGEGREPTIIVTPDLFPGPACLRRRVKKGGVPEQVRDDQ